MSNAGQIPTELISSYAWTRFCGQTTITSWLAKLWKELKWPGSLVSLEMRTESPLSMWLSKIAIRFARIVACVIYGFLKCFSGVLWICFALLFFSLLFGVPFPI